MEKGSAVSWHERIPTSVSIIDEKAGVGGGGNQEKMLVTYKYMGMERLS